MGSEQQGFLITGETSPITEIPAQRSMFPFRRPLTPQYWQSDSSKMSMSVSTLCLVGVQSDPAPTHGSRKLRLAFAWSRTGLRCRGGVPLVRAGGVDRRATGSRGVSRAEGGGRTAHTLFTCFWYDAAFTETWRGSGDGSMGMPRETGVAEGQGARGMGAKVLPA
ncbi:hypothetical protein VUR80DRAFT_3263 [Thermomyces stellatus]